MTSKHFTNAKYLLYTPQMSADYSQYKEDSRKSQYFKSKANMLNGTTSHINICT